MLRTMPRTTVIGTGTWGTAIAAVLGRQRPGAPVLLWGRPEDDPAAIQASRRHQQLPGATLPDNVVVTDDPATLGEADLVLWAVPTPFSAAMAAALRPHLPAGVPVISLAKGIEQGTLRTVTAILRDLLGGHAYGCLSGPTHAEEVVAGLPTGAVVAGPPAVVEALVARLHGQALRLYTAADLLGVELCGALKNVIAVAAGICTGLELGDNALATLVTRGLAEMRRIGRALGADEATFAGLAGVGDLVTTCYSTHGRNRALGMAAAAGRTADDYMRSSGMIAEGAWTCRSAVELGRRHGVELPISEQVDAVLWRNKPVRQAIADLLGRASRDEKE
jgi:glycerol-3-phosphate dehydrogenase (NAD(P)+)